MSHDAEKQAAEGSSASLVLRHALDTNGEHGEHGEETQKAFSHPRDPRVPRG